VSPKLPQASGQQVVKLLKSLGYNVLRKRGSHIRLSRMTVMGEHRVTVPDHKEVAKGTLNEILSDVSLWNGISKEDLIKNL
jgi:predicted RNA binding protein YcfA (HicA-like mRNA interferase family)